MLELHAIVSGRVQMVMMRDFVQRKAKKLGLRGYVKNLPDGTVEVVAQGEKAGLDRLVQYLYKGSLLSHVEKVNVLWSQAQTTYDSFEIMF